MYETVKVVNGYEIYRLVGSRRSFWVNIKQGQRAWFRTIKAAAEFISGLGK